MEAKRPNKRASKSAPGKIKVFYYVVDHDNGFAPNPYFGFCTLCRCKYNETGEKTKAQRGHKNIVELAEVGDWIIGTGGASKRSAGHGNLVYAMQIDEKVNRGENFSERRFAVKKRTDRGEYQEKMGDNLPPLNEFERDNQFALISWNFWYFGSKAICIPESFKCEKPNGFRLEKKGPGFRYVKPEDFDRFFEWLKTQPKPTEPYKPCGQELDKNEGSKTCKLSC